MFITRGLPIDCADITIRNPEVAIRLNKKFLSGFFLVIESKSRANNHRKAIAQSEIASLSRAARRSPKHIPVFDGYMILIVLEKYLRFA
ncbi:MAG TPA: hypothetical protein VF658_11155 [Pyrinomonadaceae bacterium]